MSHDFWMGGSDAQNVSLHYGMSGPISHLIHITHCTLHAIYYILHATYCMLFTTYYILHYTFNILHITHYILPRVGAWCRHRHGHPLYHSLLSIHLSLDSVCVCMILVCLLHIFDRRHTLLNDSSGSIAIRTPILSCPGSDTASKWNPIGAKSAVEKDTGGAGARAQLRHTHSTMTIPVYWAPL